MWGNSPLETSQWGSGGSNNVDGWSGRHFEDVLMVLRKVKDSARLSIEVLETQEWGRRRNVGGLRMLDILLGAEQPLFGRLLARVVSVKVCKGWPDYL